MAIDTVNLKSEERRRQVTLMLLGGLLVATTLPVVNQRALFSPLGDVPILGDLSPVAYAMIVGSTGFAPHSGRPGASEGPPRAFAARTPGDPLTGVPPARTAFAGTPSGFGNTPGTLVPSGTPFVGSNTPGGGGSGPGGGSGFPGGGGGGGGLPDGGGGNGGTPPGAIGAVPEPATWLTMILGFAVVGGIMRRARRQAGRLRQAGPAMEISEG